MIHKPFEEMSNEEVKQYLIEEKLSVRLKEK